MAASGSLIVPGKDFWRRRPPMRCPILTPGPTPPWPGVRRGMLKDKSKISRFIHLMGVHLMDVYLMSMHFIGLHFIKLMSYPIRGQM